MPYQGVFEQCKALYLNNSKNEGLQTLLPIENIILIKYAI
jgi:hypothetical protein